VVRRARRGVPDHPVLARVRPANVASRRVALRAGLLRAPHLDGPGEDGHEWIFVSGWPDPAARLS
jgi:[ribosomal protein S5]-alanine N-acetyltransferase